MLSLSPSLDDRDAGTNLDSLLSQHIVDDTFRSVLRLLHQHFEIYAKTCPVPLPAFGLHITPEIRRQSELYLPVSRVRDAFNRLYRAALTYQPVLESTPFHNAMSWVDVFAVLPQQFQFSANPACLLEGLLDSQGLLTAFLFESFLPRRFYGGFGRYPGQAGYVQDWLKDRPHGTIRCLDAACGTGEDTYGLVIQLLELGYEVDDLSITGWTIEPLEVWAAAHARFPHDLKREGIFREKIQPVHEQGAAARVVFKTADLNEVLSDSHYDLILCNGLLGGPIINSQEKLRRVAGNLAGMLAPDGILLAADSFHGGWKKNIPEETLGGVFKTCGLSVIKAGEGIGGIRT
jgi:SAM-dependent methyltransferase